MHEQIDMNAGARYANDEGIKKSQIHYANPHNRRPSGSRNMKSSMGIAQQPLMRTPVDRNSRSIGIAAGNSGPPKENTRIQQVPRPTRPKRNSVVDLMPPLSAAGSSNHQSMVPTDSSHSSSRSSMMEKQLQIRQQIQQQHQSTRPHNITSSGLPAEEDNSAHSSSAASEDEEIPQIKDHHHQQMNLQSSVVDLMPPLSAAGASSTYSSSKNSNRNAQVNSGRDMAMRQVKTNRQQQPIARKEALSNATGDSMRSISSNSSSRFSQQRQQQNQGMGQKPVSSAADTPISHKQGNLAPRQPSTKRIMMQKAASQRMAQSSRTGMGMGMGMGIAAPNVTTSTRGLGIGINSSQQKPTSQVNDNVSIQKMALKKLNEPRPSSFQREEEKQSGANNVHNEEPFQKGPVVRADSGNSAQRQSSVIHHEKGPSENDVESPPPQLQPKHRNKLQQKLERVRKKLKKKGSKGSISYGSVSSVSTGKRSLKYEVNDSVVGMSAASREDLLLCSFPSSRSAARLNNVSSHATSEFDEENEDNGEEEEEEEETLFEDFPTYRQTTFRLDEEDDENDEEKGRFPEQKNTCVQQMEEEFDSRKPWRKAPAAVVEQRTNQTSDSGSIHHNAESTYSIDLYANERHLNNSGRKFRENEDLQGSGSTSDSDISDPDNNGSCSDVFELIQAEEALELMQDIPRKEPELIPYKTDSIDRIIGVGGSSSSILDARNNLTPQPSIRNIASKRNNSLQRQNSDDSTFTSGSESEGKMKGKEDKQNRQDKLNKGRIKRKPVQDSSQKLQKRDPERKDSVESNKSSGRGIKNGNKHRQQTKKTENSSRRRPGTDDSATGNPKGTNKKKGKKKVEKVAHHSKNDNNTISEEESNGDYNPNILMGMSLHTRTDSVVKIIEPEREKQSKLPSPKVERRGSQTRPNMRTFSTVWTKSSRSIRKLTSTIQGKQGGEVEDFWHEEKKKGPIESFVGPFAWEHRWKILIGFLLVLVIILGVSIPLASRSKDEKPSQTGSKGTSPSPAPANFSSPPPTSTLTATVASYREVQSISGSDESDYTGSAVSFSSDGSFLAVGSRSATGNSKDSGTVVVYELLDGFWSRSGMSIEGIEEQELFGTSVSISDNGRRLVAGAPRATVDGEKRGESRVFEYDEDTFSWSQLGDAIRGTEDKSLSGFAVAISGNGQRVAVGEPKAGDTDGSVRVFEFDGEKWVPLSEAISGMQTREYFGYSVSLSGEGDVIAVGTRASSVSVFQFIDKESTGTWKRRGSDISGQADENLAGHLVSISADGSRIAVGSPGHDNGEGEDAGLCRVFDFKTPDDIDSDNTDWVQLGSGLGGNRPGEKSGTSVSISRDGSKIACGGASDDNSVVRVYEYFDNVWAQIGEDLVSSPGTAFGYSLSLTNSGEYLATGAPHTSIGQFDRVGQVLVYEHV